MKWGEYVRVIAGTMRGRQLKSVKSKTTRPTSDKIKEAIFHKIGPFFNGGVCLDLFAGSGSLGIEAISRGMDQAILIEKANDAVQVINQNVTMLKITDQVEVYRNDAFRALDILRKKKQQFNLIMLDPPYELIDYNKVLAEVIASNIMVDSCIIYCEHAPDLEMLIDDNILETIYTKKYSGTTSITLFRKKDIAE